MIQFNLYVLVILLDNSKLLHVLVNMHSGSKLRSSYHHYSEPLLIHRVSSESVNTGLYSHSMLQTIPWYKCYKIRCPNTFKILSEYVLSPNMQIQYLGQICNFLLGFCNFYTFLIYIYIYIYIERERERERHPQTDCFVLSELFSVARHAGRLEPGSKPVQLYVRQWFRPLVHQADHVG